MESVNISIPFPVLLKAIEALPKKQKSKLYEKLHKEMLDEFEDYDNSEDVKHRIAQSMDEYKNGKYKTLAELRSK